MATWIARVSSPRVFPSDVGIWLYGPLSLTTSQCFGTACPSPMWSIERRFPRFHEVRPQTLASPSRISAFSLPESMCAN